MHPVSIFPSLLTYGQFAPFLIRIVLGITLAYFGWKKVGHAGDSSGSNTKVYGWVEVVVAIFLIIGLYTQVAALINVIILVIKLGFKAKEGKLFNDGVNYYVLLLTMAIALMFSGAGMWAFDLPL